MIRVRDQTPLWNATYNRDLAQILAVQAEIAQAIAQGIERGLRPDGQVSAALARPLNAGAHEAYLRGDYAKAVQLDPGYAAAFSGLANKLYYPGLFGFRPPREAFTRMMNAASGRWSWIRRRPVRTRRLHWANSTCNGVGPRRRRAFAVPFGLTPPTAKCGTFFAHFLLWTGRAEESARECSRALELDPFNPDLISCLGFHYLLAGDEDKALEATRRALSFDPKHGWSLDDYGLDLRAEGHVRGSAVRVTEIVGYDAAEGIYRTCRLRARGTADGGEDSWWICWPNRRGNMFPPYDIAVIYAGLDDKERAFEWLNTAYEEHSGFLLFMNSDPRLGRCGPDPRFQDLLRRMRFPNRQA